MAASEVLHSQHTADIVVEVAAAQIAADGSTAQSLLSALAKAAFTADCNASSPDLQQGDGQKTKRSVHSKNEDDGSNEEGSEGDDSDVEEDEDDAQGESMQVDGSEEAQVDLADTAINHYIGRKTLRRLVDAHGADFAEQLFSGLKPRLVECANLRGGRFIVEALLKCDATAAEIAVTLNDQRERITEDGSKQLLVPLLDEVLAAKK